MKLNLLSFYIYYCFYLTVPTDCSLLRNQEVETYHTCMQHLLFMSTVKMVQETIQEHKRFLWDNCLVPM